MASPGSKGITDTIAVTIFGFAQCCVRVSGYLKHSEEGLGKVVKGASLGLGLIKVELSTKHLHSQQGEDDNEEEEQQQQGSNGFHGVEQRCHQVTQRLPVTVKNHGGSEKQVIY